MSKATSTDQLDKFLGTYEDYLRYETDILNIANKHSIVGYLFTQEEVATRFPALLPSWHAPLKNPGEFHDPDFMEDKENIRAADPNAFNKHKAATKNYKNDIHELNSLRLAVISSLPPDVRHLYENAAYGGKFAELKTILQIVKEKFIRPDANHLRKALARCQEAHDDRQTVEQFIDVHIVVHNLFRDAAKPLIDFTKLQALQDAAAASEPRYTFPLNQFATLPEDEKTFRRLANLLIAYGNSSSCTTASAFAATTASSSFANMTHADKLKAKATFTSSTPSAVLKNYIDSFNSSPKSGRNKGEKRKLQEGDKLCTCHGMGNHTTEECDNGGKACNGKGPLSDRKFTHYNVDGSKYIAKQRKPKEGK